MTKIKLCGITRSCDIEVINNVKPEYIGFVFAKKSRRYVDSITARALRQELSKDIKAVGVFVDEPVEKVARLLNENIIDIAQLHGNEDEEYIRKLRALSNRPIIKAFRIEDKVDTARIEKCSADYVLLDSGAGSGQTFNWKSLNKIKRPYFLAGGLDIYNVAGAIRQIHPFAVDVSSGIETDGLKDKDKMMTFVSIVRETK